MQLIPILEVAISLALLYLLFSQIVSSVHELLTTAVGFRGKYLRQWLNEALSDPKNKNWVELLYLHPIVDTLAKRAGRPPAYIAPELFAKGIIDLVIDEAREHTFVTDPQTGDVHYVVQLPPAAQAAVGNAATPLANPEPLAAFKAGLARLEEGNFKSLMRALLQDAEANQANTFDKFHQNLVGWYNDYMDRVTGWYKQRIRWNLFGLGLLLAVGANLDTLRIAHYFWTHAGARQRVVAYAEGVAQRDANSFAPLSPVAAAKAQQAADSGTAASPRASWQRLRHQTDSLTNELRDLGFPIGWSFTTGQPGSAQHLALTPLPDTFIVALPRQALSQRQPDGQVVVLRRPACWIRYLYLQQPLKDKPQTPGPGTASSPDTALYELAPASWQTETLAALAKKDARYLLVPDATQATYLRALARQQKQLRLQRALAAQYPSPEPAAPPAAEVFSLNRVWSHLLGWLLTASALCFGAPFWFDLLKRFVNIRNVGPKPDSNNTPPVSLANRS